MSFKTLLESANANSDSSAGKVSSVAMAAHRAGHAQPASTLQATAVMRNTIPAASIEPPDYEANSTEAAPHYVAKTAKAATVETHRLDHPSTAPRVSAHNRPMRADIEATQPLVAPQTSEAPAISDMTDMLKNALPGEISQTADRDGSAPKQLPSPAKDLPPSKEPQVHHGRTHEANTQSFAAVPSTAPPSVLPPGIPAPTYIHPPIDERPTAVACEPLHAAAAISDANGAEPAQALQIGIPANSNAEGATQGPAIVASNTGTSSKEATGPSLSHRATEHGPRQTEEAAAMRADVPPMPISPKPVQPANLETHSSADHLVAQYATPAPAVPDTTANRPASLHTAADSGNTRSSPDRPVAMQSIKANHALPQQTVSRRPGSELIASSDFQKTPQSSASIPLPVPPGSASPAPIDVKQAALPLSALGAASKQLASGPTIGKPAAPQHPAEAKIHAQELTPRSAKTGAAERSVGPAALVQGAGNTPAAPSPMVQPAPAQPSVSQIASSTPAPATSGATRDTTQIDQTPAGQVHHALLSLAEGADGSRSMTISLKPKELGEVAIELRRRADGSTAITVSASQPTTLHELSRNAAHLHAALDAADVPTLNRTVTFAPVLSPQDSQAATDAKPRQDSPPMSASDSSAFSANADQNQSGGRASPDDRRKPQTDMFEQPTIGSLRTAPNAGVAMRRSIGINITA